MTDDARLLLNVRTIRVTLASALRHVPPEQVSLCVARARQLLHQVREETTSEVVIADIDALDRELSVADSASMHQG